VGLTVRRVLPLVPSGTAWPLWRPPPAEEGAAPPLRVAGPEDAPAAYFGWEVARCAFGLAAGESRVVAAMAAACVASMRAGSTRLPLSAEPLSAALAAWGANGALAIAQGLLERARSAVRGDPVKAVIGLPGERKPLIVEGEWLYTERMHALEERFCARIRERALRRGSGALEGRALARAVAAVASGPPALTPEQERAVREALGTSLALITGGPGTGKTATAVALLRAIAWTGAPMAQIAVAAPTGKAAQRLADAIALGLAQSRDLADAGLGAIAPAPQTLHRLLGWSPSRGRFARHENDPLPYRFVVVDEASMIDLAMMDRLVRALRPDARLVLLGDADQLPSIEAGAVFRDLCAGLGAARLSVNLRVAGDPSARRITEAARAVNAGVVDARFADAVVVRRSVDEVSFEGVEHLAAPWSEVGDALLDRWWRARVSIDAGLSQRVARTYRLRGGEFDDDDRAAIRALFEHHARSRLLCVTRVRGFPTSAETVNDRLLARLRAETLHARPGWRARELCPGAPVSVQRNDYDRGLYNGDQGVVVRVASDGADAPGSRPADGAQQSPGGPLVAGAEGEPMAVFPRGSRFDVFPLDSLGDLAPSFAMTVHKAQGSEFDHVAIVLPDTDLPLLTRELVYTAMTRARRSVLLVGDPDLLARAVSRALERFSGVAARLKRSP
jgi:exodeoxyribonuclease V alpha subunit